MAFGSNLIYTKLYLQNYENHFYTHFSTTMVNVLHLILPSGIVGIPKLHTVTLDLNITNRNLLPWQIKIEKQFNINEK